MVASESCIKGLGFDKGPCVTNLIVLNHSDWALISFELTHGSGILSGLWHPLPYPHSGEVHRIVSDTKGKWTRARENADGWESTIHHIVAAWRTSMGRKMPVLNMVWWVEALHYFIFGGLETWTFFVLQAAFNIFFDDFWVYKPFCTLFFSYASSSTLYPCQ